MSNAQKDEDTYILDAGLTELMRDVDTYIAELSQENTPTRAYSLQQPQRGTPHPTTYRSHTIHRTHNVEHHPSSYQPPGTQSASPATLVEPSFQGYGQYNHSDYVNTYLARTPREKTIDDTPSRSSSTSSHINHAGADTRHLTSPLITQIPSAYAYLSVLSRAFLRRIRALENVRDLFCANEYPESFTGQEAIKMLTDLLESIPEAYCVLIANTLMGARLFEPVHYSQKSIIRGIVFNSPDEYYTLQEDMAENEVPTGILASLLECYSYTCVPGQGGCYSPRCPNKFEVFVSDFNVVDTTISSRRPSEQLLPPPSNSSSNSQLAWVQRVPKELLSSLSKREIARQEAINELIYSEQVYKNDLDTLVETIVNPLLAKSNIIPSAKKREEFIKEAFGNCKELVEVSCALLKDLIGLQRESEFVPMVGDTLIQHMAYFENPFSQYCPRVSLAEYLVKEEQRNNPDFERFIVQVEKTKRMRRLPFRHFLLNPVTRMQRYPLLVEAILKKTDRDHPDHTYLTRCLDMVKKVASQSDTLAEVFKKRVQILEMNDRITFKQGEFQNLQLTDPHRRLYYQGDLKRRSNGIEVTEKSDIRTFLFDHLLLMTKVRKSTNNAAVAHPIEVYRVWKNPIPLQMLHVVTNDTVSHHSSSTARSLLSNTTTGYLHVSSLSFPYGLVPLTFYHLGKRGGVYSFSCLLEERQKWVGAIEEAKTLMKKRSGEDVYEVITLDDTSFRTVAAASSSTKQGKVNCTVPFYTINNEAHIAVGTDTGVHFKSLHRLSTRKVLSCENVTQLAVLEKYHILLVLADKTLKAYPLDLLVSPASNGKAPVRLGQELEEEYDEYFHLFRASEFYVGAEASNVHFLKTKMLIVCERGFEIIDPENLSVGGRDIPDKGDPQFNFVHRQAESIKPLAMYRVHDKFLLCYDKFCFYVNNRNGSLVYRGPQKLPLLCEWEGNPENIVFQYPYIIAFDPQFIEIHHIDTGDLVQIIPGDQIRLTYFQTLNDITVIQGCMTHTQRPEIQSIFYLKLNPQRSNNVRKFI
ncbi:hypothetical protein INT48_004126 [Thamnidium elegans]|uniref:Uncharacterized protein n=1 Tax=Thamnidium elegans TaxID=101142 RepID=A0A8H7SQB0_9FUNG|nr:hypothetical protein INT48_004126 [Thamnidium elegans]